MTDDSKRAWEVVLASIERDVLAGSLRPGDRLPGERALAATLGVGRSSVREALRVLEVLGLISTASGSGPLAGAIIVATPSGGMSLLMRLQVALNGFPVEDIVRTRLVLESAVAADLASAAGAADQDSATRQNPETHGGAATRQNSATHHGSATHQGSATHHGPATYLVDATLLLDAMDSPDLGPADFLVLDAQFHVALAEASGNLVITAMMAGLRSSIESYVLAGAAGLSDWPATSIRLRGEHRDILTAIRTADVAGARSRMHNHISTYYAGAHLTTPVRGHESTLNRECGIDS